MTEYLRISEFFSIGHRYDGFGPISKGAIFHLVVLFSLLGITVILSLLMTTLMKRKGYYSNKTANIFTSCIYCCAIYLRYGLSREMAVGMLLFFSLLYASMSDLTNHVLDDCVSVIVLSLSLSLLNPENIALTVIEALVILIPQIITAAISPDKAMGGADIKLSVSLAILLGPTKGILHYFIALLSSVIIMGITHVKKKDCQKKPFAFIPYLCVSALLLFLI